MKAETHVSFSRSEAFGPWIGLVRQALLPLSPRAFTESPYGMVVKALFDSYSPELDAALDSLSQHGLHASIRQNRTYTPQEIAAADFLHLSTPRTIENVDESLTWAEHPICPHCPTVEAQWDFAALRLSRSPDGCELAHVDWHPLVISRPLLDASARAHLTGLHVSPVGTSTSPDWFGLQQRELLPPLLAPPTRTRRAVPSTPSCAPHHLWGTPISELYLPSGPIRPVDVQWSYELYGSPTAPARLLVASQRAYRLWTDLGVDDLIGEPIRLLG